jgi:3-deoxy-D-manno-octulosonic-acid transferase
MGLPEKRGPASIPPMEAPDPPAPFPRRGSGASSRSSRAWPAWLHLYGAALDALAALPWQGKAEAPSPKWIRGLRQRSVDLDRFQRWGATERDLERPLVWVHAPSVGEGLQARAVLEVLLRARPDLQSIFTHFSPSARPLARRMPVDLAGALPLDGRRLSARILDALRPDLLVFTKTEVWPLLTGAAAERGIPVALIAATLPEEAGRLRWPGRHFVAPGFRELRQVLAISAGDAGRFPRLGVHPARVQVTGDPGVDSAWVRIGGANPEASHLAPFRSAPRPTLVAGSTWPKDEAVLLEALRAVRSAIPGLRVILAPHEPDAHHLQPLEDALERGGWSHARLGEVEAAGRVGDAEVIVVDRVGVLAELYTVGDAAFVGGGFHGKGLHSVLEPAAAGLPVVFGGRGRDSLAARELQSVGGAMSVETAEALAHVLSGWWAGSPPSRSPESWERGTQARTFLAGHRGASERTVEHLLAILPPA